MPKRPVVVVRSAYDQDYQSDLFGIDFIDHPTLAKQAMAEQCDINTLVKRWERTGSVGLSFNSTPAQFIDVSEVPDYQSALNTVLKAQSSFAGLSSSIRDRFQNDPAQLLAFLDNEKNRDEAVMLGLVSAPAAAPEAAAKQHPQLSEAAASEAAKQPSNSSL